MSNQHSLSASRHAGARRTFSRLALAALASVSGALISQTPTLAQKPSSRPLIPFARQGAPGGARRDIRISPQEAAALLRGYQQRDKLPAFEPRFAPGKAGAAVGTVGTRAASPNIINTGRTWVATGPVNLDPPFSFLYGPLAMAGRVNAVAWDPVRRDASGRANVLYIATASGGVWRATIDYGLAADGERQPAKQINDPLLRPGVQPLSDYSFPTLSTSSIAIHPTNSRIVYVGTGDFDTGLSGQTGVGVGIMKTVNDGRNWVRVGASDRNGPIMEGTCVSAIVIDPNNPRRLVAASGRGTNPGYLWLSEDEGNTWRRPSFFNAAGAAINPPAGDWSSVDYSAARSDRTRARTWYATCINNGVYRSDDAGLTWRQLNVPLRFNTQGAGGLALEVAASKVPSGTGLVYVIDASQNVLDGRLLKSTDRGVTWVEINGNYPEANGGNFGATSYATHLFTGIVPTNVFQGGVAVSDSSFASDVLFGGSRLLSASLATGVRTSLTGPIFGGGQDVGAGPSWINLTQDVNNHYDQHGIAQRPGSIANGEAYFAMADSGGVYGLRYTAGAANETTTLPGTFLYENAVSSGTSLLDINSNLTVQQLIGGDFVYTRFGQTRFIGGSDFFGVPLMASFLDDRSTDIDYTTAPSFSPVTVSNGVALDDLNAPQPPGVMTPTTVPEGLSYSGNFPNYLVQNGVFDEGDSTGNTQFVWINNQTGSTGWPAISLYYTNNNWSTALDISPDRYRLNIFGTKLETPQFPQVYVFNRTDPQDTATGPAWVASRKPDQGQRGELAVVNGSLLVGTSSLWRYDPPGRRGPLVGPTAPFTYPNKDHGYWRQVGNAAITTTGYITAIKAETLGRIYVGTSTGEMYFTLEGGRTDTTEPLQNLIGRWTRLNTPPEFVGRPITSIEFNPRASNGNIDFDDIVVTLGGAGSGNATAPLPRVWRNTNATVVTPAGVSISRFTPASGQGSVQLPDVPANSITRDPDDGDNTFFVATDIGVFATTTAGSTWTNATAPLGLPNVKANKIKVVAGGVDKWLMVATAGRGVWRFNLAGLVNEVAEPDITADFTINRINGELVSTVLVRNNGGAAYDVRITPEATALVVNGQRVISSSFPVVNGVAQPILLGTTGTLGRGQTETLTLRYPGTAPLRPGTLATYRIGGTLVKPPLPPGTPGTFSNGAGRLLRLP